MMSCALTQAWRAALELLLGAHGKDFRLLVFAAVIIAFGGREFGFRDLAKLIISLRQIGVTVEVFLVAAEPFLDLRRRPS